MTNLPNTLRTSLYQFRWLGLIQTNGRGKVRTPLFWTTRWLDVLKKGAYEKSFHAIDLAGQRVPSGHAIKLWNDFVHDTLVKTTVGGSNKSILSYAGLSTQTNELTVWLVNIRPEDRTAAVRLRGIKEGRVSAIHVYAGTGPEDVRPSVAELADTPGLRQQGAGSTLEWTMRPYSITTIRLSTK